MRALEQTRARFLVAIDDGEEFVRGLTTVNRPSIAQPALRRKYIEWLHELAFLKTFCAWEVFLEDAFGWYVLGKRAPSGFRARRLRGRRLNVSHAQIFKIFRRYHHFL